MSDHENLDHKLEKIAKAGIGAVGSAVEKSKEALSDFVSKENLDQLADKGEDVIKQVQSFGEAAAKKVKDAWDSTGIAEFLKGKGPSVEKLAELVHSLPDEMRSAFQAALDKLDEGEPIEDGSLQSDEAFEYGKTVPSASVQEAVHEAQPTAAVDPDDARNTNKMQINDVNDHIPQSVPPDY